MINDTVILVGLVAAALWTVLTRSLLRSAIGLALTSLFLSVLMFRLSAPFAAVFELSVCTGLISVVFVSAITLTHPLSRKQIMEHMKERLSRFGYLPLLVVAMGIALTLVSIEMNINLPAPEKVHDVRFVLWNLRQVDLLGQAIILLAGVFSVVLLLKERKK
jgi:NADH-quinone oxidoreductase subunit J